MAGSDRDKTPGITPAVRQQSSKFRKRVMDKITPARRSWNMSRVKGRNTAPELIVRQFLYSHGYRYRLHRSDLPGKPDIVFVGRRKVIFVNGCFWHGHSCRRGQLPTSNREFWVRKVSGNKARDQRNVRALRKLNWQVLVLWECELKDIRRLQRRIIDFLA
ncbi:very short patch repair endonuclease [Bradyrhizobium sp. SZCCHNR2012]|uniref:very short patch repair endonuclease n=1 Tax=Bradyrhizobium sp. SZCCHNR2012 TaxID=3057377 RepID=UPI0028E85C60|nr:very short patch repair endonuclease [Bradyrhizobium sp. SZCCHNR2012]